MRMVTAPEAVTIEITDAARLETTRYEIQQKTAPYGLGSGQRSDGGIDN